MWLFFLLESKWFRCWIKDQTRLGGDLFTKDVMSVGMKIYECFVWNIRLKTPDYTYFVLIWGVCWVCMIQMRHYCLKVFQIPYHNWNLIFTSLTPILAAAGVSVPTVVKMSSLFLQDATRWQCCTSGERQNKWALAVSTKLSPHWPLEERGCLGLKSGFMCLNNREENYCKLTFMPYIQENEDVDTSLIPNLIPLFFSVNESPGLVYHCPGFLRDFFFFFLTHISL